MFWVGKVTTETAKILIKPPTSFINSATETKRLQFIVKREKNLNSVTHLAKYWYIKITIEVKFS